MLIRFLFVPLEKEGDFIELLYSLLLLLSLAFYCLILAFYLKFELLQLLLSALLGLQLAGPLAAHNLSPIFVKDSQGNEDVESIIYSSLYILLLFILYKGKDTSL